MFEHKDCCSCECHNHDNENRLNIILRLIFGTILFIFALFLKSKTLYIISYLVLGYDVVLKALSNVKNIFSEYFLMTIATIGAFCLGEFPEACAVMLFYQIGEFLSDYAQDKAKDSIGALMDLRCDTASLKNDGHFENVPSETVDVGDVIRVLAGEKIPLDGKIISGSAYIDTKSLTGESVPRLFNIGDEVLSGYIVGDSVIEIEVTRKYEDSTASKILALLSDEKKAKSEKFISRFARIYTPIVVALAVIIAVIPSIWTGEVKTWLYRAILFLVVSCPCALVVSVPLSFFAGLGRASLNGILIKGASTLENAAKIKNFAFDKTGTITDGKFCVRKVICNNCSENELLKYCASAEFYSHHPIARAIRDFYEKEIDESLISNYREIAGKGVLANVENHRVAVGSADFVGAAPVEKNTVYVSIDSEYIGSITVSDMIKPEAVSAVCGLKKLGISVYILTGDSTENAKDVAKILNIPYFASLLPGEKADRLSELKKSGVTAFAGDGINDAPVLSIADVGISMGKIGSDAAIEASDVVLTSDNLKNLPSLIKISKKTMRIVYGNTVFSILVKVLVMLFGAFGLASVWIAVFADVGVLILAVLNSLRAFLPRD